MTMLFPFSLTKNDQLVSSDDSPLILVGRPENFFFVVERRRNFLIGPGLVWDTWGQNENKDY